MVAVMLLSILPVVSTAECVGELLAIKWEAQMHLDLLQLVIQLIDSYSVYVVSVTHGACRNHIWTLAAGVSEGGYSHQTNNCPCSKSNGNTDSHLHLLEIITTVNQEIQPAHLFLANHLYSTDPLWDGHQCEGQCYSNGKSPPWFSVDLPNTTTDDIEVHICIPRPSYDNIVIQLLELYIQYK